MAETLLRRPPTPGNCLREVAAGCGRSSQCAARMKFVKNSSVGAESPAAFAKAEKVFVPCGRLHRFRAHHLRAIAVEEAPSAVESASNGDYTETQESHLQAAFLCRTYSLGIQNGVPGSHLAESPVSHGEGDRRPFSFLQRAPDLLPFTADALEEDAAHRRVARAESRNESMVGGSCPTSNHKDGAELHRAEPLLAVLQSEPPPSTESKDETGNDYYVNVGYAIRTLREELPTLFYKEMTYDIYRDDITFQDPLNTFRGLKSYKNIFWALRFHGRIFFKALLVDVNRVWQPNDRTITVRWSVRGIPRVPWEAWGRFDGTSEYKLDKNGKIYAHKVDNIVLSDPPKYRALSVVELLQLSGVRTPSVTCFGIQREQVGTDMKMFCTIQRLKGEQNGGRKLGGFYSSDDTGSLDMELENPRSWPFCLGWRELGSVTWFRFYLALTGTMALRDDLSFAARALLLA